MENEGDNGFAIQVAVVEDAITVTMPGTRYSITYRKGDEPWLLASDVHEARDFSSRKFIFRARAWTAANEKARELGWIVLRLRCLARGANLRTLDHVACGEHQIRN